MRRSCLVLLGVLCAAAAASAGPTYSLTGRFTRNLGRFLNVPMIGNTGCGGLTLMSGPGLVVPPPTATPTSHPITRGANTVPTMMTAGGNVTGGIDLGCVRGTGAVMTTGAGVGGALTLPANAFAASLPAPTSPHVLQIRYVTAVQQATTSFAVRAPTAPAKLRASAWKSQAGRTAPSFTWCFGSPGCGNIGQGVRPLIVKYTAGPNRFGGTIGAMISAGTHPSRQILRAVGSGGPFTFVPIVSTGLRATGRGYAIQQTDPSAHASAWAMTMMTAMGRITMGTTYLGPRPLGGTRKVYGFPFTTGKVLVRNAGTSLGNPMVTTLTAAGGDVLTSMGARNITLVAGGIAAFSTGGEQVAVSQILLPEPSGPLPPLVGAIALVAIAARRARKSGDHTA